MVHEGKHHNSALCHIATALLTRIIACWRAGEPYVIGDLDGSALTPQQGRQLCEARYTVAAELRTQRRSGGHNMGTGRRRKESTSAPSIDPPRPETTPLAT
jgi:hypothetical protein